MTMQSWIALTVLLILNLEIISLLQGNMLFFQQVTVL